MIRLLKWLAVVALVATLILSMIFADALSLRLYVAMFFGIAILGWLASFFYARKAFFQVIYLVELSFFFLWELTKASLAVAFEVVRPDHNMKPGIIAVPLDTKSDLQITIFSSLVTLTPGTLSLDVSADKSHLFVHAMYIENGDSSILAKELKDGFERRVIRILN